jgi:hypothetical protein
VRGNIRDDTIIHGYRVPGTGYGGMRVGTALLVNAPRPPVPGTPYPVPGTWYPVPGTPYPVPRTRYPA